MRASPGARCMRGVTGCPPVGRHHGTPAEDLAPGSWARGGGKWRGKRRRCVFFLAARGRQASSSVCPSGYRPSRWSLGRPSCVAAPRYARDCRTRDLPCPGCVVSCMHAGLRMPGAGQRRGIPIPSAYSAPARGAEETGGMEPFEVPTRMAWISLRCLALASSAGVYAAYRMLGAVRARTPPLVPP